MEYILHIFSVGQREQPLGLYTLIMINCFEGCMSQHFNKVFSIWANIIFPLTIESLLLIHTETQTWWGIYRSHLWTVKCFKPERNTTQGQDYRSVQHNGFIMGGNVWTPSNAPVSLSIEGNVKVQDTLFTAGSSGNWNVSFFSIALQLSLDLVGTKHAMNYLTLKSLILWSTHGSSFFKLYFRRIYNQ